MAQAVPDAEVHIPAQARSVARCGVTDQEGTVSRRRWFAQVPDDLIADLDVSPIAVRLWGRLDHYAGRYGASMPTRAELAEDLGVSEATIKRAFAELVATGWIGRRRIGAGNVWESILNDQKVVTSDPYPGRKGVTSDPYPDDDSQGKGSPVTTFARETGHGRPGKGSLVTRPIKRDRREVEKRELPVPRADARATSEPQLPLDLDEPPAKITTERAVQLLVGAYVDAWKATRGICTTAARKACGSNVRRLIEQDGIPLPVLLVALERAGTARSKDIDRHLGEVQTGYRGSRAQRDAMFDHWTDLARRDEARRAAS